MSTTSFPAAHRLFVFRCVEIVAVVVLEVSGYALAVVDAPMAVQSTVSTVCTVVWLLFAALEVALLVGFRRAVAGHAAAPLARWAVVLATVALALSALLSIPTLVSPQALSAAFPLVGAVSLIALLISTTFDVVFWLSLERLLGRVETSLRVAFFGLRFVTFVFSGLSMLTFVSYEAYRAFHPSTGLFATIYPWLRFAMSVAWDVPVAILLHRLSRTEVATTPLGDEAPSGSSGRDYLVGGLWLGGGIVVTLASYSSASGGGRFVVTTGAIVYGLVRIVRGLTREAKR